MKDNLKKAVALLAEYAQRSIEDTERVLRLDIETYGIRDCCKVLCITTNIQMDVIMPELVEWYDNE